MTGELLGHLKNGAPVFDRVKSHIHTEYDKIYEYLEKTLPHINPPAGEVYFHYSHDFGGIIGESICVPTVEGDKIIYAQRPNRQGLTRFVKNKSLRPVSVFTVVLKCDQKSKEEQYILITAYIGENAPPEPWDKMATDESLEFWNQHALVWGSLPIMEGTETEVCPW